MAFPGPYATVYYNEAGEPLGWDNNYPDDPNDRFDEDDRYADYDPHEGEEDPDYWIDVRDQAERQIQNLENQVEELQRQIRMLEREGVRANEELARIDAEET